jgi:hypothetical protein
MVNLHKSAVDVLIPEVAKRIARKAFDENFTTVSVSSVKGLKCSEKQLKRLSEAAQQELDQLYKENGLAAQQESK